VPAPTVPPGGICLLLRTNPKLTTNTNYAYAPLPENKKYATKRWLEAKLRRAPQNKMRQSRSRRTKARFPARSCTWSSGS